MATAMRSRLILQRALLQCAQRGGAGSSSGSAHAAARHVCAAAAAAAGALQLGPSAAERLGSFGADLLGPALPLGGGASASAAARWISSSSAAAWAAAAAAGGQPKRDAGKQQPQPQPQQPAAPGGSADQQGFDSLELTEEKISAITDKIPQRPVGVVEGTSYSAIILAAFGCLAYFVYNFVATLVLEPVQQQCFNAALERLRADPRITVRLGPSIVGYGQETANRSARAVIPHQVYRDALGREHVRLQFHMRGPGGTALVSADMYRGGGSGGSSGGSGIGGEGGGDGSSGSSGSSGGSSSGEWEYSYLVADVATGSSPPQRLNIVMPR